MVQNRIACKRLDRCFKILYYIMVVAVFCANGANNKQIRSFLYEMV